MLRHKVRNTLPDRIIGATQRRRAEIKLGLIRRGRAGCQQARRENNNDLTHKDTLVYRDPPDHQRDIRDWVVLPIISDGYTYLVLLTSAQHLSMMQASPRQVRLAATSRRLQPEIR